MTDLTYLRGRLTLVLTPELRELALSAIRRNIPDATNSERGDLIAWFQAKETPDGYVLDAAYSEAEATMIDVILRATLELYAAESHADPDPDPDVDWDRDAEIRLLTR